MRESLSALTLFASLRPARLLTASENRNDTVVEAVDKTPDGLDLDGSRLGLGFRDLLVMDIGPSALGGGHCVEPRDQSSMAASADRLAWPIRISQEAAAPFLAFR
jgi:hypothetical protein